MQAQIAYCACMESIQYTIRAVPKSVDKTLRRLAKQQHKSLNAVALELLEKGAGLASEPTIHTDLDFLIGTWQEDPAFDAAIAEFDRIDEEAWK